MLKLRETTIGLPNGLLATEMDGLAALRMIVSLSSAKNAIDVGTFTGMSALVLAKVYHPIASKRVRVLDS